MVKHIHVIRLLYTYNVKKKIYKNRKGFIYPLELKESESMYVSVCRDW